MHTHTHHMHTPHIQRRSRNLCIAPSFPLAHFLQESAFFIWSKWKYAFQVENIIWTPISVQETQIIRTGVVALRYFCQKGRRSRVWLINSTVQLILQSKDMTVDGRDCEEKNNITIVCMSVCDRKLMSRISSKTWITWLNVTAVKSDIRET